MNWFSVAFTAWGAPVSWLEVLAFGLALWMIAHQMRVQHWTWPLAIASSALYAVLFANSKLYGEAGLQVFFAVIAAWGWWQWKFGTQDGGAPLVVRHLAWPARAKLATLALAAWPLLGLLLDHATDSDVPYFDAFPTAFSVAGQWLLGRKYVENWPTWVLVNVVSVGLFGFKGLWLTVALYALFAVMALAGWRAWARLAK